MPEQFANNASTTLNGAINNSVTSITVTDGTVFPASGDFRLLCESELMLCTARSGNVLTVTRGHESSPAASHATLAVVELIWTRGSIEALLTEHTQLGGYASRPATPRKGAIYTATDLLNCEWAYDGSNWNLIQPAVVPYNEAVDLTGWTANNSPFPITYKNGIGQVNLNSANGANIRGWHKNVLGSVNSLTITLPRVEYGMQIFQVYIGYRDSVSGRLVAIFTSAANTGGGYGVEKWNNATSFSADAVTTQRCMVGQDCRAMKIENDGTNINFYISADRKNFVRVFTEAKATFLTNDQSQYGIWFYRTSSYPAHTGSYNMHILGVKET